MNEHVIDAIDEQFGAMGDIFKDMLEAIKLLVSEDARMSAQHAQILNRIESIEERFESLEAHLRERGHLA